MDTVVVLNISTYLTRFHFSLTSRNQVFYLWINLANQKHQDLHDKISVRIIRKYSKNLLSSFPLECLNYTSITNDNERKKTYITTTAKCDNNLLGWHRFEAATGTKMPTSCVPQNRCNTHASGWLNGTHPTIADGLVTRQVCFSHSNCCRWSLNIQVRNCGDFYIYNFMGTPSEHPCNLRYCSTDWTLSERVVTRYMVSVTIFCASKPYVIRFAGQTWRARKAREPYLTEKGKTLERLGINKKDEV